MRALSSLLAVMVLAAVAYLGVELARAETLFGIVLPALGMVLFLLGVVVRVLRWARSPVPFRIPTTCGQQKSLSWIQHGHFESPFCIVGVLGRMALEVLFFRSLFRNTRAELRGEGDRRRLVYSANKWLWAAGLAFHYSFLIVFLRHLRFFVEPVPWLVGALHGLDSFFQVGVPALYITDAVLLAAVSFLFLRRVASPHLRHLSLPADYFPLFLIGGIAVTGVLMRYFFKVDTEAVKYLGLGLLGLEPRVPSGIGALFYVHLFLVSTLAAYLPWSKLIHMGGVFLSPTRNLANNNRAVRHVNPWNYPVKVHTYAEWEEEFHDKLKACGLPIERDSLEVTARVNAGPATTPPATPAGA